ncbi:MAG: helix-turn-helix domain-containing protein [Pseudomonadota bacterium]
MPTAALLVTEGCFASTLHGLIDALACATYAADEIGQDITFETTIVSKDGKPVMSSSGYKIPVDQSIHHDKASDVVIVVPAIPPNATDIDVTNAMSSLRPVLDWMSLELTRGTQLASSCTGSFMLAEAGLLNGKHATTHWRAADVFRRRYPDVILKTDDLVTDNGTLICGGGAASHVNLSLHLIRRFGGEALAFHCAHTLIVDPGRNLQSPYALMNYETNHGDSMVSEAQEYIARNFKEPISIPDLAVHLNVGDRTLSRRFKAATGLSVGLYIQEVRIEAARNKLATTESPLQTVVSEVGFEDYSSFARLFKKRTGITMQSYRERFRL